MSDKSEKTATILIIDDNESEAILIEEAVKSAPYANKVYRMNNANDALCFMNKKGPYSDAAEPDMIFLDLKMPDFDGHEFLRVIKEDIQFKHIPTIVLSTSQNKNDIHESYKLHANCFIKKPTNFITLKKTITVIIEFWLGIASLPQSKE